MLKFVNSVSQAMYFNAYLEDAKRPQLPDHPSNTAKGQAMARRPPPGEMGPPQGPPGYGGPMMGHPPYGGGGGPFRGGFRGGFDHCKFRQHLDKKLNSCQPND